MRRCIYPKIEPRFAAESKIPVVNSPRQSFADSRMQCADYRLWNPYPSANIGLSIFIKNMDAKTLRTLEYPKILERLAGYCAFEGSAAKARSLRPTTNIYEARRMQTETAEAIGLLTTHPSTSIGGARDISAESRGCLPPRRVRSQSNFRHQIYADRLP